MFPARLPNHLKEEICKQKAQEAQRSNNLDWNALASLYSIRNIIDRSVLRLAFCYLPQS